MSPVPQDSRTLESKKELEEEHRLLYVAMTRAKRRLFLIHAFERELYGSVSMNEPSRFLTELPQNVHEKVNSNDLFGPSFGQDSGGGNRFSKFRTAARFSAGRTNTLDEAFQESYEEPTVQADRPAATARPSQPTAYVQAQKAAGSAPSQPTMRLPDTNADARPRPPAKPGEWKSGQSVQHPVFGRGVIVSARGETLTIAFSKFGLKKLDVEHAPLDVVS